MTIEKNFLIIVHKKRSLCGALSKAYIKGLKKMGQKYKTIYIENLKFNLVFNNKKQKIEKDLEKSQEKILWSSHIVLIYLPVYEYLYKYCRVH